MSVVPRPGEVLPAVDVSAFADVVPARICPPFTNLVEALAEVWQGAPARQISEGGRTAWQNLGRGQMELQRTTPKVPLSDLSSP